MHVAPDFEAVLDHVNVVHLDRSSSVAYGLRAHDLTLAYCNDGWDAFAMSNGGIELVGLCTDHVPVLDAVSAPVKPFYRDLYRRVVDTGQPADHLYACHSPERHRWFRMRVTPLPGGLLVVHHLSVDRHHTADGRPPDPARYLNEHGFSVQCCHCRNTRRVHEPDTWDWVPAYLDTDQHEVSHGLCPVCFAHYHPDAARARRALLGRDAIH